MLKRMIRIAPVYYISALPFIVIYFFITLFANLLSMLEGYVGQVVNFKVSKNVQIELFDKMIRMKTSAYSKYEVGELISRLNGDADNIVSFAINLITGILQIAVNIILFVEAAVKYKDNG